MAVHRIAFASYIEMGWAELLGQPDGVEGVPDIPMEGQADDLRRSRVHSVAVSASTFAPLPVT